MVKYVAVLSCLALGASAAAAPLPDIVLYGSARLDGAFVSSGTVEATVNGQTTAGAFTSEAGIAYYSIRIPVDHSIGSLLRPGAVLLDGPEANRTVTIEVGGYAVAETPLLLSEPGIMRLDVSATSAACSSARDDDGTRDSAATIDYSDDYLEKTVLLGAIPPPGSVAQVWVYGQPYNFPGHDFVTQQDYYLRVNGNMDQRVWFDVGAELDNREDIYQWFALDIPTGWLQAGANTLYIREGGGSQHYNYNNLRVGVDTDNDVDRSWWHGNGVTACHNNPSACLGELMIYLEWCGPACGDGNCGLGEDSCSCPGDCPGPCCGDGSCQSGETSCSCPQDCAGSCCGNGSCEPGESTCSCWQDCGSSCGDGCCNGGESVGSCSADCGGGAAIPVGSTWGLLMLCLLLLVVATLVFMGRPARSSS